MSTSTQYALKESDSQKANHTYDLGLTKLKTLPNSDLCKRVLLLNSMGTLIERSPSFTLHSFSSRFQSKEEWRKHMASEFLSTQTNPDASYNIVSAPKNTSLDSLTLLMDCLQITNKKRSNTNSIRGVRSKTIDKGKRGSRSRKGTEKR
ncbi:hypothetical protein DSO57_1007430 [Entomophthora muscae]|uniref:Uncharacterized protein n=1 Tax=Entomophthora muscae TaxID=34485 RepID=A0ACC2T892_9FUNG|nr:hypothetical protein DSO57_1007430 [Entomophthora muscae]